MSLHNFRNYSSRSFSFSKSTTVIVGPNAVGKTSIIEALHLLSSGDSLRAGKIEEMIRLDQELGRVKGLVESESGVEGSLKSTEELDNDVELEVLLTRGLVQGKRTLKRHYLVNGIKRQKRKFIGNFLSVTFRPEDMRLIEGSKGRRRSFMDTPLNMIDAQYARSLKVYQQALVRRNKLLWLVREGESSRSVLTYWNMALIKHGQVVQEKRRKFLNFFQKVEFPLDFGVEYAVSIISQQRMARYQDREIAAGHTLIGPHKDDLIVKLGDSQISQLDAYGSRGQQRMGVLWLKVCELEYISDKKNQQPVLLLDDILSELDHHHRQRVLSLLKRGQSVVTTTDKNLVADIRKIVNDLKLITL